MNTQNKIRSIAMKTTTMLISAIYLAVSVNVPVLAQDVTGPITDGNYEGDVEVTAGRIFNDYMAGVSATDNNTKVSVGNNLSVTSDTGSTVTGVYVTGADAEVSVGKDLSVVSEFTNTRGIDAQPNANTAAVTIGNDLTVDSKNTMNTATAYGIEARPAAGATANITVGNSDTNQGNVTVSGTEEVKGISIATHSSTAGGPSQGNTNITVGGGVTSSISESNEGNAKGVYLKTQAGAITNVDIGGAVNANGNTKAMGLDIYPDGNNTNKIDVVKGISASAAEATGVFVQATNTSNTTINIGKDSSGNAIKVHSDGDNNKAANSSGINAQLHTGEFTGSTTAKINVEGNIVVSSEAAGARGIYADGGDSTNLNIQVKGDVTSNGAGIYTKDMSSADLTDIIIDGTVKSTADGIPAVILDDSSINNGQVSITAWKIESNDNKALLGKSVVDENNNERVYTDGTSRTATAGRISYIIRVTQPEINNTPVNVISLANADGTAWNTKKAWDNREGVDPTMLDVAGENERVYVKLNVPNGYQVVGVYADAGKTVALTKEADGRYSLVVPRGGGIDINADIKLVDVTGVVLDKTSAELDKGKTLKLTATVLPENAANKNVIWSTSDSSVATVNNGTVKALAEGVTDITVTTEDGNKTASCRIEVKKSINGAKVVLSAKTLGYTGKAQKPSVKSVTLNGKKLSSKTDYTLTWSNKSSKKIGKYTVTVKGKGNYSGSKKATYEIVKGKNPLKIGIKKKTLSVPFSKLKKGNRTIKRSSFLAVSKGQGKVTYSKSKGNKNISIDKKTGNIKVKKGLKKGTYKVTISVKAAGNKNYKASSAKKATVKIVVK